MRKDRSPITTAVVAIVIVLAVVFLVAQCQASNSGECSDDSLGVTRIETAAFSSSESGGTFLSKPTKKPKVPDIFDDNDCD